jgi:hypothetical protein
VVVSVQRGELRNCSHLHLPFDGEVVCSGDDVNLAEKFGSGTPVHAVWGIDASLANLLAEFDRTANGKQNDGSGITDHVGFSFWTVGWGLARIGRRLLRVLSRLNQNGAPRLNSAALAAMPQK